MRRRILLHGLLIAAIVGTFLGNAPLEFTPPGESKSIQATSSLKDLLRDPLWPKSTRENVGLHRTAETAGKARAV